MRNTELKLVIREKWTSWRVYPADDPSRFVDAETRDQALVDWITEWGDWYGVSFAEI